MTDCEESMKKELKDFDRAAKSEVGGREREESKRDMTPTDEGERRKRASG